MMPIGRSTASASSQSRAVVETGSSCQGGCSCMATSAQDGARDTQRGKQCGRRDQDLGWFHQQVGKAMFDQSGDVQHGESPDSVGAQCASCAWIHSATSPIRAGSTVPGCLYDRERSEEHTSELQSLMRISYAVFCLKKKKE